MAKFSIGGDGDGEGPSTCSPRRKRQRINLQVFQQEEEEEDDGEEEEIETGYSEDDGEYVDEDHEEEQRETVIARSSRSNLLGVDPVAHTIEGSLSVFLTDPEVLDCIICYEPLAVPVFQCENGHIACSSCCTKIGNKCPSCSWPIGYNRCRAIEKVIESVKVLCQNAKYGCEETVSYSKKYEHEKACNFAPCACPLSDCNYMGSSKQLYLHITDKHSNASKNFRYDHKFPISLKENENFIVLREENGGGLFILANQSEILWNRITVCCIEPYSTKRGFFYYLWAREADGCSLKLESFTQSIQNLVDNSYAKSLIVPADFLDTLKRIKLEICIWRRI